MMDGCALSSEANKPYQSRTMQPSGNIFLILITRPDKVLPSLACVVYTM